MDFSMSGWDDNILVETRYSKAGILVQEIAQDLLYIEIFSFFSSPNFYHSTN
jgi:hypothetical protein